MSKVEKENVSGRAKMFETILSSPGMNEKCKVVLQLSRQSIVLLSRLVETGLEKNVNSENEDEILQFLPTSVREELQGVVQEALKKGALEDFYSRITSL
jgi:hypothetical protein